MGWLSGIFDFLNSVLKPILAWWSKKQGQKKDYESIIDHSFESKPDSIRLRDDDTEQRERFLKEKGEK